MYFLLNNYWQLNDIAFAKILDDLIAYLIYFYLSMCIFNVTTKMN